MVPKTILLNDQTRQFFRSLMSLHSLPPFLKKFFASISTNTTSLKAYSFHILLQMLVWPHELCRSPYYKTQPQKLPFVSPKLFHLWKVVYQNTTVNWFWLIMLESLIFHLSTPGSFHGLLCSILSSPASLYNFLALYTTSSFYQLLLIIQIH